MMLFTGAIVNCLAVILGAGIGLLFKRGLSEKISVTIMNGLGLGVLYIGIKGALSGENMLIIIVSLVVGVFCGELLDLEGKMKRWGNLFKDNATFSEGFLTASLMFCVGAMAIVGSLQSGLALNHEILLAKSLIDGIAAWVLAASLGAGVMFAGIPVLLYEGGLTLLAQAMEPYLTPMLINELTCVGSLLIVAIALNMLKITKLKIANYLPALVVVVCLCLFFR